MLSPGIVMIRRTLLDYLGSEVYGEYLGLQLVRTRPIDNLRSVLGFPATDPAAGSQRR